MKYEKATRDIFRMTPKQHDIIVAAMELTAERGINGFSLSHVAQRANTSERLIYSYYGSKKNLLYSCFSLVNRDIEAAYKEMECAVSGKTLEDALRSLWNAYFSTLVRGGYGALFYHAYRNSEHIREAIEDEERKIDETYFDNFNNLINNISKRLHLTEQVDMNVFWTYVMDTTTSWAGRIIRGDMEDTVFYRESAWKLLFGGISGLLPEEEKQ